MITCEELLRSLEMLRESPITEYKYDEVAWKAYDELAIAERLCDCPLVSVIVTTYNQARFIGQTLESIVMQQCDFPYEVIVADDASTDETHSICKNYLEKYPDRIRIIRNKQNQFVSAPGTAGHRSLALARGKYIAICEGDDFWCSDQKLQLQVERFRNDPELAICYTDFATLRGEKMSKPVLAQSGFFKVAPSLSRDDYISEQFPRLRGFSFFATASIMVKKEVAIGLQETELGKKILMLGDYQLRSYAATRGHVAIVPVCCAVYRLGVGILHASTKANSITLEIDSLYAGCWMHWDLISESQRTAELSYKLGSMMQALKLPLGQKIRVWYFGVELFKTSSIHLSFRLIVKLMFFFHLLPQWVLILKRRFRSA